MGRGPRDKPIRLAEKLKHIRQSIHLSQDGMLARLALSDQKGLFRSSISGYERGDREPTLLILLAYARVANVYVEALIDDEVDLPDMLPVSPKSEGIRKVSMPPKQSSKNKKSHKARKRKKSLNSSK
jgi:transcriptional regulator with XRE-family HTH domain